jgi:hypothetical protein
MQGEAAARFLRKTLGLVDERVDIFAIVRHLGVTIRSAPVEPPTLDGLAIWGASHGPGAFLNEDSKRVLLRKWGKIETSPGARVTLAHELCHLLLDGGSALSAIEVLKARMPVGIEQRARSFAGEFLLPGYIAAAAWFHAGQPSRRTDVEAVVVDLTRRFGVTRSVAAWKLEHGTTLHDVNLGGVLDSIAPYR